MNFSNYINKNDELVPKYEIMSPKYEIMGPKYEILDLPLIARKYKTRKKPMRPWLSGKEETLKS